MRILIDIGHPGHVHLFKNFAWIMQKKGHSILFTTREKEFEIDLLKAYKFKYISFGEKYKNTFGKVLGLFKFDSLMLKTAMQFKPDIFLSHGSMYAAQISSLLRKPHISMEDTYNFEQIRLYLPFTNVVLTGNYEHAPLGKKEIRYNGYHELAYLHPNYYSPDPAIFKFLNIKQNQKFILIRFVSWKATHDIGHSGINLAMKYKTVYELSKYAKVFISSENNLPEKLRKYQIVIPPEKMHDAISYATLLFGESATMASEAAVLGTPAIFHDDSGRGYTNEEEKKYGLVFNFSESIIDQEKSLKLALELINKPNIKEEWSEYRKRLLMDKIDVTAFLVWFVENYPISFQIMKKNPDYQYKFK